MKKAIQIPNAPSPVGPYSQAILAGGMLFVSGQIPLNPETGELEMDNIETATHRVMKNIVALLEAAELNIVHVVKTSIFLEGLKRFSGCEYHLRLLFSRYSTCERNGSSRSTTFGCEH
jgi:2-iminobutanoate/2-iminopropanoate deaminase